MPTIPPPISTPSTTPQKPATPPAPPQTMSSSKPKKVSDTTLAAILFFAALLLLCGLIGAFLFKSYGTGGLYKLEAPVLINLPEFTNKNTISVEGTAAKNASIEITDGQSTVSTVSDKNGKFVAVTEIKNEGKVTYSATATKRVLFFTVKSDKSNEVSTTYDKTAPNIKLIALPKTVTKSEYTIQGSTSEPTKVTIKVNNKETVVETDKDNKFSLKVSFVKGTNSVTVVAKDAAGNETASATATVTYSTGTITNGSTTKTGTTSKSNLPNSSGELEAALNTVFGRAVALAALVLGVLGFTASSSVIWLVKTYRKN